MKQEGNGKTLVPTADYVSTEERKKLVELGRKLEELETQRAAIMKAAREIIGFETAESVIGINEELEEAWMEVVGAENVLVAYARATRRKWQMEDAVKNLKRLMNEIGMRPHEIEWGDE